jgi:hypothetical protein
MAPAALLIQSLGSNDFGFDAAVVHLASPINGITPIMLVTPGRRRPRAAGAPWPPSPGWGNTIQRPVGPGGGINYPDRMREAQVPIVSRPECQTVYSNVGAPPAGASVAARPASPGSTPASATGGWGTSPSRQPGAYR